MSQGKSIPSRRGLLTAGTAALLTGAAAATAAHAMPGAISDADLAAMVGPVSDADMSILRLGIIANGSEAPIRRRALYALAEEALRLAALEPPDTGDIAPGHPDAELIALVSVMAKNQEAIYAIEMEPDGIGPDAADQDRRLGVVLPAFWDAADRVVDLAASTPLGRMAKAEAMRLSLLRCVCTAPGETLDDIAEHEFEHRMAWSFARDVLAGSAAA
jgi:hypothetical protein